MIIYRLAISTDGPAIGKLFAAADYGDLGVDWHAADVTNGWLVADRDGEIIGALQLHAGQPYGFLGDCVVLPSMQALNDQGVGRVGTFGAIALTLGVTAVRMLSLAGSQIILGLTPKPAVGRMLKRYGAASLGPTELFARRAM